MTQDSRDEWERWYIEQRRLDRRWFFYELVAFWASSLVVGVLISVVLS